MTDDIRLPEITAYLVGLYGQDPHGLLWIGGHADGWRGQTFNKIDDAATYAIKLDDQGGIGVYHRSTTLAHVPERRGDATDSHSVHYFALDVDIAGPGHKAENLPADFADVERLVGKAGFPAPTTWVASGGGFYPQWRFASPIDVRTAEQREWVEECFAMISSHFIATAKELGWHLDNVRDLARVFRLPGTTNRKVPDTPVPAYDAGSQEGFGPGEAYDLGVLASLARPTRGVVHEAPKSAGGEHPPRSAQDLSDDLFDGGARTFTRAQAVAFVKEARTKLATTESGFNAAINNFAMACAHFPWLVSRERCGQIMIKALTARTGWTEPDANDRATIDSAYSATEKGKSWVAAEIETAAGALSGGQEGDEGRLLIRSGADMAYWLAENAGRGRMAGFFLRDGEMVHTPRVNETGYVPAPDGGKNGPAEIRAVSAPVLAAKLQYLYECYKQVPVKDEKGKAKPGEFDEVAALFPVEAARRATDAPEAMRELRPLTGLTGTPMVRADGSLLATAGYDEASGYLFLPEHGVDVPEVPERPGDVEIAGAREILLKMISDFPFATDGDRANYFGLLLTPLLRQVAPPSYKMFGIGAHQPGSGKSLLAEIVSIIHGGVLRSEVPEDEAEWRKQGTTILATTSAPVVVIDNIMGVLKSSYLAGLLTAGREVTDRELGKMTSITVANDRVWVVTGNNLSIGGDLVRRTITVLIDPDTPNPEKRTDFVIPDLRAWVTENRNLILWSLLTLIRAWVAQGMPEPVRKQSDSFAKWQRVVSGILEVAGIPGEFDKDSGQRAAAGGDDDGLTQVLETLWRRFADRGFSSAEAMEPKDGEGMLLESRDWLPGPVLDRAARSEAAGRKALGWWFRNRVGRWVTNDGGLSLVLREVGKDYKGSIWKVETR